MGEKMERVKYRFTLQWGAETAEKMRAGDLVKSLGSRKSEFIVAAISEYTKSHPEMLPPSAKVKSESEPGLTLNQVEVIVRKMMEARQVSASPAPHITDTPGNQDSVSKGDIDVMLKNLDMFTK